MEGHFPRFEIPIALFWEGYSWIFDVQGATKSAVFGRGQVEIPFHPSPAWTERLIRERALGIDYYCFRS